MYSVTQLAEEVNVTKRLIRYYVQRGLLEPTVQDEAEMMYFDEDARMQLEMILLLKSADYSLSEIKEIISGETILESLVSRRGLLNEKVIQLQTMLSLLNDAEKEQVTDLKMLYPQYLQNTRNNLWQKQFSDPSNLQDRIDIHSKYSTNEQGWFPWVVEHLAIEDGDEILEIGCGTGGLWETGLATVDKKMSVTLTDKEEAMVTICKGKFFKKDGIEDIFTLDAQEVSNISKRFDKIIMNHVIYILPNPTEVLEQLAGLLKPDGRIFVATLGDMHMYELRELLKKVNRHINLQTQNAKLSFLTENAAELLPKELKIKKAHVFEDSLVFTDVQAIEEYIYSVKYISNLHQFDLHTLKYKISDFLQKELDQNEQQFYVQKATTMFEMGKVDE